MKTRFFLLSFLLLFARGCDFYSTSLWFFQPGGMADETNFLTRFLGVGWAGLILANVFIIGLLLFAYYRYSFKYSIKPLAIQVSNFREYISTLYYGRKDRFYWVMYKTPKTWKAYTGHFGYAATHALIVGSFLATIHNLCQFYQLEWYAGFRELVVRPQYVIYGLIILTLIGFYVQIYKREYRLYVELEKR